VYVWNLINRLMTFQWLGISYLPDETFVLLWLVILSSTIPAIICSNVLFMKIYLYSKQ